MRRPIDSVFLIVFGGSLIGAGLWLLGTGEVRMPLRRGGHLAVSGVRLWLMACSPSLAGAALLLAGRRVARTGVLGRDQVTMPEKLLFLAGIAALVLALLTAPRVVA